MRFLVHPPTRDSVRLERPGPGGKGKLSVAYPVRNRWVEIPDATCAVFAAAVASMIDAGTLIVPVRGDEPPAKLPHPAELRHKRPAPAKVEKAPPEPKGKP